MDKKNTEKIDYWRRRIKELRKFKGWSQRQLSEKAGVSQAVISHLESGRKGTREGGFGSGSLESVLNVLGVSYSDIFSKPEKIQNDLNFNEPTATYNNDPDIEHINIIKKFKNKRWAIQVNNLLKTLEDIAPDRMELIKNVVLEITRGDNLDAYKEIAQGQKADSNKEPETNNKDSTKKVKRAGS